MSFSLYFFHINKDMITHRQAAHQPAEKGHEQAQPDSTRCAQTNHGHKPASWNPSITSVQTGIAPAAPSPWPPCTLGFSPLKSRSSCVRTAGPALMSAGFTPRRCWRLCQEWWGAAVCLILSRVHWEQYRMGKHCPPLSYKITDFTLFPRPLQDPKFLLFSWQSCSIYYNLLMPHLNIIMPQVHGSWQKHLLHVH